MTYFLNAGSYTWFISATIKGVDYVFGIRKLHPDNLDAFELSRRVVDLWS